MKTHVESPYTCSCSFVCINCSAKGARTYINTNGTKLNERLFWLASNTFLNLRSMDSLTVTPKTCLRYLLCNAVHDFLFLSHIEHISQQSSSPCGQTKNARLLIPILTLFFCRTGQADRRTLQITSKKSCY